MRVDSRDREFCSTEMRVEKTYGRLLLLTIEEKTIVPFVEGNRSQEGHSTLMCRCFRSGRGTNRRLDPFARGRQAAFFAHGRTPTGSFEQSFLVDEFATSNRFRVDAFAG